MPVLLSYGGARAGAFLTFKPFLAKCVGRGVHVGDEAIGAHAVDAKDDREPASLSERLRAERVVRDLDVGEVFLCDPVGSASAERPNADKRGDTPEKGERSPNRARSHKA